MGARDVRLVVCACGLKGLGPSCVGSLLIRAGPGHRHTERRARQAVHSSAPPAQPLGTPAKP